MCDTNIFIHASNGHAQTITALQSSGEDARLFSSRCPAKLFLLALLLTCPFFSAAQTAQTDSLENVYENTSDAAERLSLLHQLTNEYVETNLRKAFDSANQGIALAIDRDDPSEEAAFLLQRGDIRQMLSQYDSAQIDFDAAITIFENSGQPDQKAVVLERKAAVFQNQGRFDRGVSALLEALKIWEKLENERGAATIYAQLSDAMFNQERPAEGAEYGKKSIAIFEKIGDEEGLAQACQFTADNYLLAEEYEKALPLSDRALEIKQRLEAPRLSIASAINSRANILKWLSRYEEALDGYRAGLEIVEQLGHEGGISAILANIADVYMRTGRWEEALPIKIRSADMQEKNGMVVNLMENYRHLSTIYKNLEDFPQALRYYEKYDAVRDSMLSIEKDKATAELRTKYETEKKEALIASQEERLHQQRLFQRITIGFVTALALILLLLYRNYRQKQQVYDELKLKNAENELLLKEIHHRVKNNLEIVSSLLKLQSVKTEDPGAKSAMRASQSRVQSMGIIHQKLYQKENLGAIEMLDYFRDLSENLIDAFGANEKVEVNLDMQPVELDVDTAVPIGLIVNELMTNSLKYAFPENKKGKIELSLKEVDEKHLQLVVADNGIGNPEGAAIQGTGFGSQLVQLLTDQLQGTMKTDYRNGAKFSFLLEKHLSING